jgi:hypothetical protein
MFVESMAKLNVLDLAQQKKGPILLGILILFWAVLLVCIVTAGWGTTWGMLRLPTMYPPFADMRSVQGALLSIAAGYNPQIYNPGDPWGRVMNYPGIWVDIARVFRFGNETSFMIFVSAFVFGYLYSCYTLLKKSPSVYLLLAMLSGASLLAVERGNNDLVIFSLMAAALHLHRDKIKSTIVLLAVILKIYPVFVVYGFFRRNTRLLVATTILASIYLAMNLKEMMLAKSGNTASGFLAYGVQLNAVMMAGLLLILVLASYALAKTGVAGKVFANRSEDYQREMFIVGGSLYIATFVLSINWDYRLIFLLFCLPYFQSFKNRLVLHASSVSVLLAMNVLLMVNLGPYAIIANQLFKFFLFAVVFVALSHELSSRVIPAQSANNKTL